MHSIYLFWYHVHGIILSIKGVTQIKIQSLNLGVYNVVGKARNK